MQIVTHSRILLIFFLSIFMGCNSNSAQNSERLSESLIVLPKAEKIQRKEIDGTIQIIYNLKEKYPASKSINLIDAKLETMGWIPLKYDELNFGAPTALATGWTKNKDQKKGEEAHVWYSIWKNETGDYIKYHFQYFAPEHNLAKQKSLYVAAILVPAKTANRILAQVNAIKEKNK
jgi:hypothetical protein